uniref:hypothetical protein n=1 Tax=Cutibacterium acnes TaxID=1747 RepID=UPI00254B5016
LHHLLSLSLPLNTIVMSSNDYYGGQGHGYDGAHQQQQQPGHGGYNQQQYPSAPAYGQPQHDQYGQGHNPYPQQQVSVNAQQLRPANCMRRC